MSDAITTAIIQNTTSPQAMTADGVSVTSQNLQSQIEAMKFLSANDAVTAISAGTSFFGRVRMVPPGARGGTIDTDY